MNDTYQDPNGELPEDDEMEMVDLITLCDEEGDEHEFELADEYEEGDEQYVALIPSVQSPEEMLAEDGQLVIMKLGTDEDGEVYYSLIEDDDEFYHISEIFEQRLAELYDFED